VSYPNGGSGGGAPRHHHHRRRSEAAQKRLWRRSTIALAALVGCVIGGVVALATTGPNASEKSSGSTGNSSSVVTVPTTESTAPTAKPAPKPIPPRAVSVAQLAALPQATTEGRIDAAPADLHPTSITDGSVVHPTRTVPIFGRPGGGPAIGALPETEVAGPTWLPIVGREPGWLEVLLPSKPNGRVGWLAQQGADNGGLQIARSTYQVRVNLAEFKLSLFNNNKQVGEWTVGTGSPVDPTPAGRTFILGAFTDPQQNYSPVILPLGVHSPSLDTFGGGPGTVAIHTWLNRPTQNVYGAKSSNGCVRVPPDALSLIEKAPLGTLVLIH
jgi:L,D-transpeptidase-like protein